MQIKKHISLILAGITAASALVSCSVPEIGSSVTASAGAEKYVDLLEDRLTEMPDSLVIASGEDTKAYGVDVTKFIDNEGYTIRANSGDVVILGKTDAGLDRAVRQFANYGNSDNYSFTYGEGYRVKKLTIEGYDISEYSIIIQDDADECMRYAADEFARYVKLATGVTLPVYSMSDAKPGRWISLNVNNDPDLGDEGFTIQVASNGIVDVFCGRYRGGLYGVYGLLEDIGWRFLGDGTEYLYESDHVDLTTDINRTETPAVNNRFASAYPINYDLSIGNRLNFHGRYVTAQAMSKYGYYGVVREACHGLSEFCGPIDWQGSYGGFTGSQPCFTDEGVLQAIEDHYRNYIEKQIAAGAVPGKDLAYIDVAQFDSTPAGFCQCQSCITVVGREGSAAGPVLKMTNRMADMAAEYSPEIDVLMLAYCGTNKPPRNERPRDNVKIAYCFYYTDDGLICSNHPITGEECETDEHINKTLYKEFEGWKKICKPDTLQVWYYPMNSYELAFQAPAYDTAFADMKYLIESEIDCIMFCESDNNDSILLTALSELVWDEDMTEEEYYALLEEYFCIVYGEESGKYIYEYANLILQAGDLAGCWCSFGMRALDKVDSGFITSRFDYMVELFNKALSYAENDTMQKRIEILKARMLYIGISASHGAKYTNGTEAERAQIAELYTEMHGLFIKYNLKVFDDYINPTYAPAECDVTINPAEAWFPQK